MGVDLSGKRVLVVGASTGIGRHVGLEAVAAGADVVFCARSRDKLESAVAEAGGGHIVVGDLREPADCTRILDETEAALGGLDLLVLASAISPLMPMASTPPEVFQNVFATNAIGALILLTQAAERVSEEAVLCYISSDSVGAAYPGMIHYAASKAALDQGVDGLRMEYPDIRFTRIAVGPTAGTAIALDYDPEIAAQLLPLMLRYARGTEKFMTAPELGKVIVEMLAPVLAHPSIDAINLQLSPPGGPVPWGTDLGALTEQNKAFTEPESGGL
jgi:NAD(P)-dependent dehydrogenase (short-subunit alcohol dehydrogenase family)